MQHSMVYVVKAISSWDSLIREGRAYLFAKSAFPSPGVTSWVFAHRRQCPVDEIQVTVLLLVNVPRSGPEFNPRPFEEPSDA
jgi:hypothetical protein